MLAIILKELRCYTRSAKYRRIQLLMLAGVTLLLLISTVEYYAHRTTDIGKQTYKLCTIALLIAQLWVPRHAVEALQLGQPHPRNSTNRALLVLTPVANWKILGGKLSAIVLWALWSICLTFPLFALSSYIGGLTAAQLLKCGAVLTMTSISFALIGITFALCNPPTQAKGISYGIVLLLTCLPLIPVPPFDAIPLLDTISPLCALLSILNADHTLLWLWNLGLLSSLSALIFPLSAKLL